MWKDSDETIYLSIQMDFQESIVFINNSFRVVIFLDEFLLIHLAKYIHPGIYCILPLHQVPLVYKEKRYYTVSDAVNFRFKHCGHRGEIMI